MYLAGSFLMFLAFLTVIGVLISDIALADPRSAHPAAGRQHEMNDVSHLATAGARARRCRITSRTAPFDPRSIEAMTTDAGARLSRLAMAADVVEVQAPQAWR